jgi:hypothetical protein
MKNKFVAMMLCGVCMVGLGLTGCRTPRDAAPVTPATKIATAEASFRALHAPLSGYETLSARLHIEVMSGTKKSFSSRVNLKILRDRKLQLSVQPFAGIEVMRVEISPDSIRMIDRINKRYLADSFDNVGDDMLLVLNFYSLQALFTNRIFLPQEADGDADHAFRRFRYEQTAQGYVFRTQDENGLSYLFTGSDEKLTATAIVDARRNALQLEYAAFGLVGEHPFPMEIKAGWSAGDATKGSVSIRYLQIDMDQSADFQFAIPKNYERVDLSQILKLTEKI